MQCGHLCKAAQGSRKARKMQKASRVNLTCVWLCLCVRCGIRSPPATSRAMPGALCWAATDSSRWCVPVGLKYHFTGGGGGVDELSCGPSKNEKAPSKRENEACRLFQLDSRLKVGWERGSEGRQVGRARKGKSQLKYPACLTLGKGLSEGNGWAKFPVLTPGSSNSPSSGFQQGLRGWGFSVRCDTHIINDVIYSMIALDSCNRPRRRVWMARVTDSDFQPDLPIVAQLVSDSARPLLPPSTARPGAPTAQGGVVHRCGRMWLHSGIILHWLQASPRGGHQGGFVTTPSFIELLLDKKASCQRQMPWDYQCEKRAPLSFCQPAASKLSPQPFFRIGYTIERSPGVTCHHTPGERSKPACGGGAGTKFHWENHLGGAGTGISGWSRVPSCRTGYLINVSSPFVTTYICVVLQSGQRLCIHYSIITSKQLWEVIPDFTTKEAKRLNDWLCMTRSMNVNVKTGIQVCWVFFTIKFFKHKKGREKRSSLYAHHLALITLKIFPDLLHLFLVCWNNFPDIPSFCPKVRGVHLFKNKTTCIFWL